MLELDEVSGTIRQEASWRRKKGTWKIGTFRG